MVGLPAHQPTCFDRQKIISVPFIKETSMVAWNDYKQMARARGSLAKELYVVVTTPVKPLEQVKAVLPDHLAYQDAQEAAGNLALAGPLSDKSGDSMQGEGLIVYQTASLEAAIKLADADPMHATGTREYTIRRWMLNEGTLRPTT
ncbi:MAG: hypothetical protein ACI8YI_001454 [Paracoccaceae bacterium]|jgi:uncharacterized protein YciI